MKPDLLSIEEQTHWYFKAHCSVINGLEDKKSTTPKTVKGIY